MLGTRRGKRFLGVVERTARARYAIKGKVTLAPPLAKGGAAGEGNEAAEGAGEELTSAEVQGGEA